ncbi:hypothetical protein TEA_011666 [Camellia sinensis var. sinensis]|uniref:Uncharacterized protein n=1 Tax=Camellia sinensis var. sinensis TaxID=542762 RepID=A0A4S4F4R9_CAMSN|nr:hypothetical protein TEA_011666 [Camellia sinensis var. sinensis]
MARDEVPTARLDSLGDDDAVELAEQYRVKRREERGPGQAVRAHPTTMIVAAKPISQVETDHWHTMADKSTFTAVELEELLEAAFRSRDRESGTTSTAKMIYPKQNSEDQGSANPVTFRAIMAEYSGAVLVLSAVLYGRRDHVEKGIVFHSYVACRLHVVFSSPKHLMVAGGCIIIMEIVYKMDFSVLGFLIYSTILGFGIYQATSLELVRKDSLQNSDLSNGIFGDQMQIMRISQPVGERSTNSVFHIPSKSEVLATELIDTADGKIGQWFQISMQTSSLIPVVQRLKTCWISLSWLKRWLSEVWGTTQGTSIVCSYIL